MVRKLIAAAIIFVLAGAAAAAPVSAEPRGRGQRGGWGEQRGRSRHWQGRRQYWRPGHGWYYDPNPLGSIFGGIIGGWLGSQMGKDRDDRDYDDERETHE